ncbi:MAG TPA: archaeal heat shock protein Hsp14 [Nitrososphaeraceae archaeon]|jgi:HSP20 family molecular chaperone IbpA|nr:archaeal heat shock protein Hsp14 [Nitrososphaeraceae archaeon]
MGFGQYMAKELMRELGNRSREFFEFVMPALDMYEDGSDLVVLIDLPGFSKQDISLRILDNVLSIIAKRQREENKIMGTVYIRQRPLQIDKKVPLPIKVTEEDQVLGSATYIDGVVTLRIPIPRYNTIPIS